MSDFDYDLDEVDVEKIGKGGGQYFPLGQFHVQINSIEDWGGKDKDSTVLQLQALASNVEGAVGKQHNDYFKRAVPVAIGRLMQYAIACRLTTKEYLAECKAQRKKPVIDWQGIVGRQCCVITEPNEYNGKTTHQVGFSIFDVDDERAKAIPKNETFLKRFKDSFPLPSANGNGHAKPTAAQPATAEGSIDDMFA